MGRVVASRLTSCHTVSIVALYHPLTHLPWMAQGLTVVEVGEWKLVVGVSDDLAD
jgi:hypothetical protein